VRLPMKFPVLFIASAALVGAFVRQGASIEAPPQLTPPTTRGSAPASQPAGFSIRGRVAFASGFGLQKPDLSRVVVYLASDPALDGPPPVDKVSVAQHNKAFVPNFVVVPLGTCVEFPNWDHFDHNVFSRSKAAPAFDLDRYPYGQSKSRVFDKVGVVQVFCNVHPGMRAMIFVTPNRFFTRADARGQFEIGGVPAGKYRIVVFHERCEEQQREIEAGPALGPPAVSSSNPPNSPKGPDSSGEALFTLEESRKSIMANDPPKRRGGYGVERGLGAKREQLNLPVVKDSHPSPTPPPPGPDASGH
jgi:plastocyanin